MSQNSENMHRLRPVEAFPIDHEGEQMILLQDPSGLAEGPLVVSPAGFFILTFFDGQHALEDIQDAFRTQFGQELPAEQVGMMVEQLELAHYMDSPSFDAFYQELVDGYRAAPTRPSRDAESYGADGDGLGPMLARMLDGVKVGSAQKGKRLAGLVAPHLDYPRGGPCYLAAYRTLAENGPFDRAVILGTNHYGRGTSVVATGKAFETPLGITPADEGFLAELESSCGCSLRDNEYDHVREHSVELQVLVLQHLFGAENFQIVPALCHDPCGPTGTAPYDGNGVDLRVFAEALRQTIENDDKRTVIIAGADLSHFGRRFGDNCELDPPFLAEIERKDREAIGAVVTGRPELFLEVVGGRDNDTRICSTGSIFTVMTALAGARIELLKYHQTVDRESGTAVSCSAMALWRED